MGLVPSEPGVKLMVNVVPETEEDTIVGAKGVVI
jgi:hypothetical protein